MKYIIIERNFIEGVLDVEFQDPLINGFFYQGLFDTQQNYTS